MIRNHDKGANTARPRWAVLQLCAVSLLVWPCAALASSGGAKSGGSMILGFVDSQPAVYLNLQAGMTVRLEDIRYDSFGRVSSYQVESVYQGDKITFKIAVDPSLKAAEPETYRYSADVNGKTTLSPSLAEWEKSEAKGCLGFNPTDLGGVILRSLGALEADATTRFAYDDFGRRMLAEQEFAHEGTKYLVSYTDYKFDDHGRLSGYSAEVKKAER